MNDNINNCYNQLFSSLSDSIEVFIHEITSKKSTLMATKEWTIKDELCHIVFWHENYAANYKALAKHVKPPLPQGMSTINRSSVISLRKSSIKNLIERLQKANNSLYDSIVNKKVPQMTYSKGGRTYETADFIKMITRHITTHTQQVKRAK